MNKDYKVKLGGKNRVFTFGLLFIGEVLERMELDYNEFFTTVGKSPMKYTHIIMFESLKNTYKKDGLDLDFTENDIITWLESELFSGYHIIQGFLLAFMGTQKNNTPIESNNKNSNVKKK